MYGTRDAAANWSEEYTERLLAVGFNAGVASPCVFYHRERGLRAYIHGDDFVVVGMPAQLKWMQDRLEEKYELTVEVLGPAKEQVKEVRVLNRIIRWTKEGIEYEADPRHVEIILKQMNMQDSKAVATPGAKDDGTIKNGDGEGKGNDGLGFYFRKRKLMLRCTVLPHIPCNWSLPFGLKYW